MTKKIDFDKPYARVMGDHETFPDAKFEQDGNLYSGAGVLVYDSQADANAKAQAARDALKEEVRAELEAEAKAQAEAEAKAQAEAEAKAQAEAEAAAKLKSDNTPDPVKLPGTK